MSTDETEVEEKQRRRGATRVRQGAKVRVSPETLIEIYATSEVTGKDPSEIIEESMKYASILGRAEVYGNLTVSDIIKALAAVKDISETAMNVGAMYDSVINKRVSELSQAVSIVEGIYTRAYQSQLDEVKRSFVDRLITELKPIIREVFLEELARVYSGSKEYEQIRESLSPEARSRIAETQISQANAWLYAKINEATARVANRLRPLIEMLIDEMLKPIEAQLDKAIANTMSQSGYKPPIPKLKTRTVILQSEQEKQEQAGNNPSGQQTTNKTQQ
jgi:hypothetical protein